MKLVLVLMVCAVAAAAPKVKENKPTPLEFNAVAVDEDTGRNLLVNALVRQMIAYIRRVINNGSVLLGLPPLDPLILEYQHIYLPAGLINLDLDLHKIFMSGLGSFVDHRAHLDLRAMTFDLDISVPTFVINAEEYDLTGDILTAIPLYGKGQASFRTEGFRIKAKLFLGQSEDKKSVIIQRIENASFELPHLQSKLTGVIGGGDIDPIVNALVEEVIVDYINRFQGAISRAGSELVLAGLNPILEQLDTWRYIAPLIPRA